jgi:hypothetical protein
MHDPVSQSASDIEHDEQPSYGCMVGADIGSFAGDSSPACMHKANALFDESFPQIQAQTYEGYGAVELMVSVLFLPALAIVACTGVLLNRLVSDFNPRSHIRAC